MGAHRDRAAGRGQRPRLRRRPVRIARRDPLEPSPSPTATPAVPRVNVLLIGMDSGVGRTTALTDTMIVVSLDPVAKTVSMASIPRDMVDVPLPDGRKFRGKINGLVELRPLAPEQVPGLEGRPVGADRRARDAARDEDRLLGAGQPGRVRVPRRLGRRREHQRHRRLLRSPLQGVRDQGLQHHARPLPHGRRGGARVRARAQGARRERLHAGRPPAGGHRGAPRPDRAGRVPRQPVPVPASRSGRRSRPTSSRRSSPTTSRSRPRSSATTSSGTCSTTRS